MNMQFTLDHEIRYQEQRGKSVDHSRLSAQALAGPNGWHDQRMGSEGLAIAAVTHRLGSEDLPLRDKLSKGCPYV
jgi:hypothetical protein